MFVQCEDGDVPMNLIDYVLRSSRKTEAMKNMRLSIAAPRRGQALVVALVFFVLCNTISLTTFAQVAKPQTAAQPQPQTPPPVKQPESLTAAEFSRLIRELSEEGGYFRSDNFTSNETSYLHVIDKMRQLGATGGAYLGVCPEQNFTYIAKIRSRIAFIIAIRRQAIIQHLMYKAIFHLSPTRPQFLSRLLSRPLP